MESGGAQALVLLACLLFPCGVSSFEFWASPRRAYVQTGGNITISCAADVHLTDCRFYMRAIGYLNPIPNRVTTHRGTSVEYFSNATGCSIQLLNADMAFYDLVACRGRNQAGEYKSTEMSLAVSNYEPYDLQVDTKDRVGVAFAGENFSLVCRSPTPLTYCAIWLPGGNIVNLSNGSSTVPGNTYTFQYSYYGAGLEKGECGIQYRNVNEDLNGIHWCNTKTGPKSLQYDYTWLVVALAPQMQYLQVSADNLYEGDKLTANCTAENSRPISTMSWFLGDERITSGIANVTEESPFWPDPHFKMSLTQTLRRTVQAEDDGKELKCTVEHVALPGRSAGTTQTIRVRSDNDFILQMNPTRAHVYTGSDVTLRCESNVALTDCRFRLPKIGFLDLSLDVQPKATNGTRVYSVFGTKVEYFWREKSCWVTLKSASEDLDGVVSCRGRNEFGKYRTAEMMLAVSKLSPFDLEIDKHRVVLQTGRDLTFVCRSPLPLIYCSIWLPNEEILDLSDGHETEYKPHRLRYRYHGQGLKRGECGVSFTDVGDALNGHVWCEAQSEDITDKSEYLTVIVATKPNPPVMSVSPAQYNVGDVMEASCAVTNSRPAATLVWFLGEEKLTEGVHSPEDATWSWDYDTQTVTQNLTRRLREEDEGRELRCVASHLNLPAGGSDATYQIKFTTFNDSLDVTFHPNRKLINSDECGIIQQRRRIINGKKVNLFDFPWMALITYNTMSGVQQGCGGALISRQYVLTAAHCVSKLPRDWSVAGVRLGEHNYQTEFDCEDRFGDVVCAPFPQNFTLERIISHPGFSNLQLQDDIALLRLDRPAEITDAVKPICLPVGLSIQKLQVNRVNMVVAGWGVTENGTLSGELRAVNVPIVDNNVCAEHYVQRQFLVTKKQLCAGGTEGRDSCKGDSGSPLMHVDVAKGKYVQYGIVSYGTGVCGTIVPTVYTHLGYYMNWILENMV